MIILHCLTSLLHKTDPTSFFMSAHFHVYDSSVTALVLLGWSANIRRLNSSWGSTINLKNVRLLNRE